MSLQIDASPVKIEEKRIEPSQKLRKPSVETNKAKITILKPEEEIDKFIERQELLIAPYEYSRKGSDPGLVLIFNQESFDDKPYRLGSRKDVNEIVSCMGRLGFNINENNIFNDLGRDKVLNAVDEIVKQDLSGVNCLILFFLTHGEEFNRLHANDGSLESSELWKKFAKCEHLKAKPKFFILQACKGNDSSTVMSESTKKHDLVPENTFRPDYIGPDMLIVYSTTEGNVSFRDPKNGTWFIQELCKNFLAYGRRDDVVSLIMRTTKCLSRNYYHFEQQGDKIRKQMPIFISTLRKKFYLNRSKERNIWLKMLQDQESLREKIEEVEKKVNDLIDKKDKEKKNK